MSTGLNDRVRALTVFDDGGGSALYVGGRFTNANGLPALHVAKWNGASWSALGGGLQGTDVRALAVFDDGGGPALYAAGEFGANHIRKWNGSTWIGLAFGVNANVYALAVFDDGTGPALYVAGRFTGASGIPASRIAKWDGSSWSTLGSGVEWWVHALAVFDDGTGPALYVGGDFFRAGGLPVFNIAKWDGSSWSGLGGGMGGVAASVRSLAVLDDGRGGGPALYAAGQFTSAGGVAVNNIAKWDGVSWSALGSGVNATVRTLAAHDDGGGPALYAGGEFSIAGGVDANRIAKWDGSTWSDLTSEVNGFIDALTAWDDGSRGGPALFVGGQFTASATGDRYFTKWGCSAPFIPFCTAKTSLVCGAASIRASGFPSASATSGFVVAAEPVQSCRAALLLYSDQAIVPGQSFGGPGNGLLCLSGMELRRAGPVQSGPTPQSCGGTLAIDMNRFNTNTWMAGGCSPTPGQNNPAGFLSNPGTTVSAQMWGRDSIATGQVLSDGIGWVVGP